MRCPECETSGTKSKVFPQGGTVTLLGFEPFYDEDGNYHRHDPNTITSGYRCSEGHSWTSRRKAACPHKECEWNNDLVVST